MRRVSVVGTTGSGKTTFAATLAARLGVPHIELDAVYHQPGWTPLPEDQFRGRVADLVKGDSWVADGNYSMVRDLVWGAADTVVVLAFPRRVVMKRIIARSLRRVVSRQELWNGNRERWRNLVSIVPERNIVLWAWTTYEKNQTRYREAVDDPAWSHLEFHRLVHPRQTDEFLSKVG